MDVDGNGILSIENLLNGFNSINQSDSIDVGMIKRMLCYADEKGNNDGVVCFNDFLEICRLSNLCYQ